MSKKQTALSRVFEVEYVVWHDNLAEMKHFCGEDCVITYESCHIDDYFNLSVDDCMKEKKVNVPTGHYVVKIPEFGLTVMDPIDFNLFFEKVQQEDDKKETSVPEPKAEDNPIETVLEESIEDDVLLPF